MSVSDLRVRRPSPAAFPRAGAWFTDPDFGSDILRVTDERYGTRCVHAYSYWPALNADSTRLLIACDDVPYLFRFSPLSGVLTMDGRLEGGQPIQFEGATWSGTSPAILFALERRGTKLFRVDVAKRSFTVLRDFAADFPGRTLKHLTTSKGSTVFCFLVVGGGLPTEVAVWSAQDNGIWRYPRTEGESVNEAQISKGAHRVVVHMNDGRAVFWAFKIGWKSPLANATGHWDMGSTWMANSDGQATGVVVRGYGTTSTPPPPPRNVLQYRKPGGALNWSIADHVSLRADDERRLLLSTYAGGAIDAPFEDEIVLVNTDGSGFERVAHTFSAEAQTDRALRYWSQPRAVISRDGNFAVWTSDLGSSTRFDVLLARLS